MATQRVVIKIQSRGGARTERAIRRVGGAARAAEQAVNGFRNVLVALAAVSAAKGLVDFVDTLTRADNQLKLLAGSQARVDAAFNALLDTANRTRTDLESTIELYARLQRSTEQLGLSQKEVLDLTAGVSQSFQIFGATSQEASSAVIQFGQALASGALRDDELRSVLEQGPRLAKAIVEGLNEIEAFGPATRVTIGDLRDLGKQGALTADLVTRALQTQLGALEEEFNETTPTLAQAFIRLQNSFLGAFREADKNAGIVQSLTELLLDLEPIVVAAAEGIVAFGEGVRAFVEIGQDGVDAASGLAEALGFTFDAADQGATGFDTITDSTAQFAAVGATLGGPIGALIGGLAGLAVGLGNARNATTELTEAAGITAQNLQLEIDGVEALSTSLAENQIVMVQQARTKLAEAESRRQNILALRDEAQARRDALRSELEGILARAQALQENRRGGVVGLVTDLDENAALIQLEGQAKNAFEVLQQLNGQVEGFDDTLASNADNIERVNDLLRDGTTLIDGSTEAQKARADAEEAAADSAKELADTVERQNNAFARLVANYQIVQVAAGTGSDALDSFRSSLEAVNKAEALGQIRTEQAAQARSELNQLISDAGQQAFGDLLANLAAERDLLRQTSEEQKLVNRLKEEGIDINSLSGGQLDALREELDLNRQIKESEEERVRIAQRQADLLVEVTGNTDQYLERLRDLQTLQSQNVGSGQALTQAIRSTREQLAEAKLEAGEGNFADALITSLVAVRGEYTNFANEFTETFSTSLSTVSKGFSDAFASAIVDGEDLNESLKSVAREGLKQLISGLIQLGVQYLLNQAISRTISQAAVASNAQIATQLAALYAPAAAAASLASFGANAAPASAGIAATNAVSAGFAAAVPSFRGGTDFFNGPGSGLSDSGLALLSRGEGVVTARANAANPGAVAALNRGERVGGQVVNNFVFPNGDVDGFRRSRRQIDREMNNPRR